MYTEAKLSQMIDEIDLNKAKKVEFELDEDGDEPDEEVEELDDEDEPEEECEPDFDDGDDDFHARHLSNWEDFGYRPFGCGDLL